MCVREAARSLTTASGYGNRHGGSVAACPMSARHRRSPGPRLRPTLVHAGAARYRRPGGPWDRGTSMRRARRSGSPPWSTARGRLDGRPRDRRGGPGRTPARHRRPPGRRGELAAAQRCALLSSSTGRAGVWAPSPPPCTTAWAAPKSAAALDQVAPVRGPGHPGHARRRPARSPRPCRPGVAPSTLLTCSLRPPAVGRASPARGSDLAVALFTSGSTGVPKAALHTHRGLGYKAALMVRRPRARPRRRRPHARTSGPCLGAAQRGPASRQRPGSPACSWRRGTPTRACA